MLSDDELKAESERLALEALNIGFAFYDLLYNVSKTITNGPGAWTEESILNLAGQMVSVTATWERMTGRWGELYKRHLGHTPDQDEARHLH